MIAPFTKKTAPVVGHLAVADNLLNHLAVVGTMLQKFILACIRMRKNTAHRKLSGIRDNKKKKKLLKRQSNIRLMLKMQGEKYMRLQAAEIRQDGMVEDYVPLGIVNAVIVGYMSAMKVAAVELQHLIVQDVAVCLHIQGYWKMKIEGVEWMSVREKIDAIVHGYEEDGDIPISEIDRDEDSFGDKLKELFGDVKYSTSFDDMVDSCGFDCWSYSIGWVENGEVELIVYRVISC